MKDRHEPRVRMGRAPRWYWIGLAFAIALHVAIMGLYVWNVFPQQFHTSGTFWFHSGGDDYDYVALAQNIRDLHFDASKYPLGFPALLLPFMLVMRTTAHDDLLPVVAAFWTLVMYPLGQLVLGFIAWRFTRQRWLALASIFLWTLVPPVLYVGLRVAANASVAETYSVHQTWAQMLSDGPATLFTLFNVAVLLILRDSATPRRWAILLGVLAGSVALLRLTGILTVGIVGLALLLERRGREALIMAAVALLVFSPQLAYQWHFFGSPFRTGYQTLDALPPHGLFNLSYLADGWDKLWGRFGLLAPLGLVAALGAALTGGARVWAIDRINAVLIALWLAAYCALYSVYYYSWQGGMLRFLMPAIPAAVIVAAGLVGWLAQRGTGNRAPRAGRV